jgi:hypothetical protein
MDMRKLRLLLLIGIALLWLPAMPKFAQAAEGTTVTYGFETQADGTLLDRQLPGLTFISADNPWRTGDVRSGTYNAPYPADCPAFGGPCAYAVNGNGFAWLGPNGGQGTLRFTTGPATSVAARFSTSGPVRVSAYDPAGELIASKQVETNIRTGRMATVRFAAPAIGSVQIDGNANAWLMDDLEIAAPILPPINGPVEEDVIHPAQVSVVQRVAAAGVLAPGSELTLTIVATNHGEGQATHGYISVPLDRTMVELKEARFSRATAWVQSIGAQAITIETGTLHSRGDTITATLRLVISPQAREGDQFGGRVPFRWRDHSAGRAGESNLLDLVVGQAPPPTVATLQPLVNADTTASRQFTSGIYAPGEPVALWYHTPGDQVVGLDRVQADTKGEIQAALPLAGLAPGSYTLVAAGVWSGLQATATVIVP